MNLDDATTQVTAQATVTGATVTVSEVTVSDVTVVSSEISVQGPDVSLLEADANEGPSESSLEEPEPVFNVDDLPGGLPAAVEAILMVADEPVAPSRFAEATGTSIDAVAAVLVDLQAQYRDHKRGFQLRELAGGWRFYTVADYHPAVRRFVVDGQVSRLSRAALETLAVVAYRQPVSRAKIAAIRGVNVDGVMRTLVTRGLIAEVGVETGSGAILYGTTGSFLERMGLDSIDDLPDLAPYLPEPEEGE